MASLKQLLNEFKCPKCNNRSASALEIPLSKGKIILGGHADRFLFLSCTLCGYTEIYNLKLLVKDGAEEKVRGRLMEPNES